MLSSTRSSPAPRPPDTPAARRLLGPGARIQSVPLALGAALVILLMLEIAGDDARLGVLFGLGLALGIVLYRSTFAFTSAYRRLFVTRDGSGVLAQIALLAMATVLFAPLLASGTFWGHPVRGAVAPLGVQVAIGAFLFGVGMQLAGGCGSGTLYAAGGGSLRMLATLVAFVAGSFAATLHFDWWQRLPAAPAMALGDALGWPMAVVVQLVVFVLLAAIIWRYGTARSQSVGIRGVRTLLAGAIALALLSVATLAVAGHPWSISWAFGLWGAKTALWFGWDPTTSVFWSGNFQRTALAQSVLSDITSIMDIGIVLGAFCAAALAGRVQPRLWVPWRSFLAAVLGGLAMGYGARLAFGCNIGAFVSGVASTSLHGWLWIAAALPGMWIAIRLRPYFGLSN